MPATLDFTAYRECIGAAATVLRANAGAAGLTAAVPTCPEWTVRDLVLHQGMVHRWAAEVVSGGVMTDGADKRAQGAKAPDVLGWFDDGATALLQALADAPLDLDVPFFLRDAGPARDAWARRQAHETTIHAVDAMAARLGRPPRAEEVWFGTALAVDGIDELLMGFLPRSGSSLRSEQPLTLRVAPTDGDRAWTVAVSTEPPRVSVDDAAAADATFAGTAREVYLALWNRGEAMTSTDPGALNLWREVQQVSW